MPSINRSQLQTLRCAYSVNYVVKDTKAVLETKLIVEIKQRKHISEPHHLLETRQFLQGAGVVQKWADQLIFSGPLPLKGSYLFLGPPSKDHILF